MSRNIKSENSLNIKMNDLSCIAQLRCMEENVGKVVDEVTRQAL